MNKQYLYQLINFAGILILPVLLFCIPVDWLNSQHSVCLFKNIFGIECWGCGITRSVLSAIQCKFVAAFYYNKLIIIVFPLLVYAWGKFVGKYWFAIKINNKGVTPKIL